MQRRTTALLLKGAFNVGQKRPGEAAAAAAATFARPARSQVPSRPNPAAPLQPTAAAAGAPPTSNASGTAAAGMARSAPLVTPPAAATPSPAPTASSGGASLRKKKIIRRIVKRKKVSHGSGAPAGAAAAGAAAAGAAAAVPAAEAAAAEDFAEENEEAAADAATMSQPAEPAPIPTPSTTTTAAAAASEPPRRGFAMLSEIRKQPEGAIEEEPAPAAHADAEAEAPEQSTQAQDAEDGDGEGEGAVGYRVYTPPTRGRARERAADVEAGSGYGGAGADTRKTPMVKGYRIEEVGSLCSPSDAMFARRLPSGGCQFFAWPGTSLEAASAAIVSMPDTIRTVHAVFGRRGTPIDLVMDIDCHVPQEYWSMSKIRPFQRKVLDDVLGPLKEEIEKIGETIASQVVLQSPNLKKASFHVHTRLKDVAFADFESLYGFLFRFQERLPNVDLQIYRHNGMLRMFSCMKENHTSAMVVFDEPKWNIGFPGGKVSDEQAALHSICVRDPATYSRLLTFEPPRQYYQPAYGGAKIMADGTEKVLPPQVLLPRTEREAVANASRWLRQATEVEVGEWRTWIGLGLCAYRVAYQFRNAKNLERPAMEEMLDAWTEASRKCPLKFHSGECEARWSAFDPEKLGDRSDWWAAYKRLGRLQLPMQEAMEREAEEASRHAARATAKRAAADEQQQQQQQVQKEEEAAPAAAPQGVPAASRKLKLQKKAFRRA